MPSVAPVLGTSAVASASGERSHVRPPASQPPRQTIVLEYVISPYSLSKRTALRLSGACLFGADSSSLAARDKITSRAHGVF